jgi:hypothetical protein
MLYVKQTALALRVTIVTKHTPYNYNDDARCTMHNKDIGPMEWLQQPGLWVWWQSAQLLRQVERTICRREPCNSECAVS